MAPMKRILLVLVAVLAVTAIPARAETAVSCRNQIYNDWYHDGKVASTYPISCYRDALAHAHADAGIYSSLLDDIRAAMQAAISRSHGSKSVPAQVGRGLGPKVKPTNVLVDKKTTRADGDPTAFGADSTSSGGGLPIPLLVLGGLALALVAAGAIGMLAKRRRGDDTAL
jgi:hypothetical protein